MKPKPPKHKGQQAKLTTVLTLCFALSWGGSTRADLDVTGAPEARITRIAETPPFTSATPDIRDGAQSAAAVASLAASQMSGGGTDDLPGPGDPDRLPQSDVGEPVVLLAPVARPITLREANDPQLQRRVDAIVGRPAVARAIREQRFAAALVDLSIPGHPRLATVNGDLMMYAASLPKIAILLGVFEQAHQGILNLDAATLTKATRMIRNSSNKAASDLYYLVGPANLAAILQSDAYRLYDPQVGGGLWVGKPYAKQDTWRRDPIGNMSHGATAFQVARFLYLLETGRLVSAESSVAMKKILGKPAIRHKFVRGLKQAHPGTKLFRKSGTWRTYHTDAAIVERAGHRYIAVMLANDPKGAQWLRELVVQFDNAIFTEYPEPAPPFATSR